VNVIRGAEAVGQGAGVGPHRGTLEH